MSASVVWAGRASQMKTVADSVSVRLEFAKLKQVASMALNTPVILTSSRKNSGFTAKDENLIGIQGNNVGFKKS